MEKDFGIQDYEEARKYLIYRLVRADNDALLQKVPHEGAFADLELVPCFYRRREDGAFVSCPVSIWAPKRWGISERILMQDAKNNMRRLLPVKLCQMNALMRSPMEGSIRSNILPLLKKQFVDTKEAVLDQVAEALAEQIGQRMESESGLKPMWVLSNENWHYGSSSLLYPGVLQRFAEQTGGNFYILPASINEVILLPQGGRESVAMLKDMVSSANGKMTNPAKMLSDSVYYYDRQDAIIRTL